MGVGVVGVAGKGEKPVLHLIPSWSEELGAWSDQERKSTGYSIVVHSIIIQRIYLHIQFLISFMSDSAIPLAYHLIISLFISGYHPPVVTNACHHCIVHAPDQGL